MMFAAFAVLTCTLQVTVPSQLAAQSKSDEDPIQRELKNLQGTWYHVSREAGGKQNAGEDKESLFVIRGNLGIFKRRAMVGQVCTIKLVDAKSDPKKVDLIVTDGPYEGKVILAIYQVDGDVLKYCGGVDARPTSFTTNERDRVYSYCSTFKRVKQ
jgi:uncharacterized protein (TIGR03067 family)